MKVSEEKLQEHAAFVAQHGLGSWSALRCLEVHDVASVVAEVLESRQLLLAGTESATRDRVSLEGEKRLLEAELDKVRADLAAVLEVVVGTNSPVWPKALRVRIGKTYLGE